MTNNVWHYGMNYIMNSPLKRRRPAMLLHKQAKPSLVAPRIASLAAGASRAGLWRILLDAAHILALHEVVRLALEEKQVEAAPKSKHCSHMWMPPARRRKWSIRHQSACFNEHLCELVSKIATIVSSYSAMNATGFGWHRSSTRHRRHIWESS